MKGARDKRAFDLLSPRIVGHFGLGMHICRKAVISSGALTLLPVNESD